MRDSPSCYLQATNGSHGCCWGCVLSKRRMDGESGLWDTSTAGNHEVQGICRAQNGKLACGTPPPGPPPLPQALKRRAPEPDSSSWWMWAMTERRSQTASALELHSSLHHHNNAPASSHYSASGITVKSRAECYCPNVWTADTSSRELSPPVNVPCAVAALACGLMGNIHFFFLKTPFKIYRCLWNSYNLLAYRYK